MKTVLKQGAIFLVVFILVGVIFNFALYGYYRLPAKIQVTGKATRDIWEPNSDVVTMIEGFGSGHTDSMGYNNPDGLIESGDYCVVMGSSHTQGFNVNQNETYCSRLTSLLHDNGVDVSVYNLGMDGHLFTHYVKHFKAVIGQFPDAEAYIFEMMDVSYTTEELNDALDMIEYSDAPASELASKQRVLNFIQTLPLCRLVYRQISELDMGFEGAFLQTSPKVPEQKDSSDNTEAIDRIAATVKECTDKPIIFFFHPQMVINNDGSMSVRDNIDNLQKYKNACAEHGITFVDITDTYMRAYRESSVIPYGFINTPFASGHLNKDGHELIAQTLLPELLKQEGIVK